MKSQKSPAPQVIIPSSPLDPVPRPQNDYYDCVGLLISQMTDSTSWGTGTIIAVGDTYGILTCAHNVYDEDTGGPASYVVFAPGIAAGQWTGAVITALPSAIRIPDGYTGAEEDPYDYAVIRIPANQVPADFGPLPTIYTIPVSRLSKVQVTGYPSEPPMGAPAPTMYYSRGRGYQPADTRFLRYEASTLSGMSGSGVYRVETQGGETPDIATITGVHVNGVEGDGQEGPYNEAIYLTSSVIQWITEQMAS